MNSGWIKEMLIKHFLNKEVIVSDPKVVNKYSAFFFEGNLNSVKSAYVRGNHTSNREMSTSYITKNDVNQGS